MPRRGGGGGRSDIGSIVRAGSWGGSNVAGVEFACPRCQTQIAEEYYGPCASCRRQLLDMYRSEGRHVEVAEYEPKMNVTPNAVALKDD